MFFLTFETHLGTIVNQENGYVNLDVAKFVAETRFKSGQYKTIGVHTNGKSVDYYDGQWMEEYLDTNPLEDYWKGSVSQSVLDDINEGRYEIVKV